MTLYLTVPCVTSYYKKYGLCVSKNNIKKLNKKNFVLGVLFFKVILDEIS